MSAVPEPHVQLAPRSVRAKMACLKIERVHGQKGGTIRLSPVTGNSLENREFWQYTPSGTFEFNSINEDAFRYFELGEEYYVDIVRIPRVQRLRDELAFLEAEIASIRGKGETLGHWRIPSPEQRQYEVESREKLARPLRQEVSELEAARVPSGARVSDPEKYRP